MKKYLVALTAEERNELVRLTRSGKTAARKLTRVRILLKADEGLSDDEIPEVSAEFVACMADVLDLYAEPYDPRRPKVNFDEKSVQLIAEKRQPLPPRPGEVARYDYEYERNGTANLFVFCEPQAGWRHLAV